MRQRAMGVDTAGAILASSLLWISILPIRAADVAGVGTASTGTVTKTAATGTVTKTAATGAVATADTSTQKLETLSVFTNGIGKGMHAVYVHANFDALMHPSGYVVIYPKDKGQRIGKPLTMGISAYYSGNVNTVARPIATFENDRGPLMNPATVELKGRLVDDVLYAYTFQFEKNTVSVRGYCKDPKEEKRPTVLHIAIGVPAYTNFPPEMLQAEREARLRGLGFVTRVGQKTVVYPYANGAAMAGYVDKCWIAGPVYGTRKLSFEVKSPDTAPMLPRIYTDMAPHNGYVIYMRKKDMGSTKLSERLMLVIQ